MNQRGADGAGRVDATQNPTDAAIERHIWPDGDWHHAACRCGAPHSCDAGLLARSLSTALEQLDFHNDRANAAIARAEAAERVVEAVKAAGPWPIVTTQGYCATCGRFMGWDEAPMNEHAPGCPGVALRDALERLDAVDAAENAQKADEGRENGG